MRKISILLTLLLYVSLSFGQHAGNTNVIKGELLVQFASKQDANIFKRKMHSFSINNSEIMSQRFHIYLFRYNYQIRNVTTVMQNIRLQKGVVNVQQNHHVTIREDNETLPNDSLFGRQWSLHNTGSGGGVAGADIDATDAWDITTGGLTATGDTIVVAIIDGGGDIHHEDVNFWKNYAEIPNNGIDDDNNGYIDDFDGWNAYNNNGNIPLYNHGMHVMGIAGAIGNNNIGITGVNWTVKTLPIAGSSTSEAIVVRALSYLYTIREEYDSTNGQRGAFVIADNCSFGVDKGNPANYPIWEAMYDSLGRIGVLSCAATANKHWDIDTVGDVPTAFATDYMISVTNTTNLDNLYPSAAWGDSTIDLGAPGTSIYSTLINNSYGYKTGTSMATPHVTGAVALIISAADSNFMINFKKNPNEGALLIKHFILKGVDTIPDLVGKTVSNGRLNVFNAITLLINAPVIITDEDSIYAEAPLNTTTENQLLLSNGGNDTLFYNITVENQPEWLTISQDSGVISGGQYKYITLSFNDEGMNTGYYYCTLKITGEGAFSKTIPISFFVYDNTRVVSNKQVKTVVFPNPVTSQLNIKISGIQNPDTYTVTLYNELDKKVYISRNTTGLGSSLITINTSNLPKGIYFYNIKNNKSNIITGKVVKIN